MAPWVRGGGEGMRLPGPQSRLRRSALPALALLCLSAPDGPGLRGQDRDLSAAWRSVFKREVDPPSPPDNPLTPDKVALGARLFSDTRLSGADRSCASCHVPARAFSDGRRRPIGLSGRPLPRNTPSLAVFSLGSLNQFLERSIADLMPTLSSAACQSKMAMSNQDTTMAFTQSSCRVVAMKAL